MRRLILIFMVALCSLAMARAEGVPYFEGTVYEALTWAQRQHKMLIVEFYAEWNYRSRWMSENVIAHQDVYPIIDKSYVIIKVDTQTSDGSKLAQAYQIHNYPTFVIFNQNGNVVDKIEKTMNRHDFISRLGQVIIENDGKSGWELHKIFTAVQNGESQLADKLTIEYLERIGKEKAISPYHWELFSNTTIVYYRSETFDYILKNKEECDRVYTKIKVDEVINRSFYDAAIPHAIGIYQYDSLFVKRFREDVRNLKPTYSEALLMLISLSEMRNYGKIDEYIRTVDVLARHLSGEAIPRLVLSTDFIAERGTKEQKNAAKSLIRKYGRYTNSETELELINILDEKLSE